MEDGGMFQCVVSNAAGESWAYTWLKVKSEFYSFKKLNSKKYSRGLFGNSSLCLVTFLLNKIFKLFFFFIKNKLIFFWFGSF